MQTNLHWWKLDQWQVGEGEGNHKVAEGNFGRWWVCFISLLWWWFCGCVCTTKIIKRYALNMCSLWILQWSCKNIFKNSLRVLQLMYVNQASRNKKEKKKLYFWPCYPNWLEKETATPLQYSCLENLRDRGAWWATVCGVTKSQTWLND